MATLNRRDYYAAIPQLEGKLSNLSKYITVTEGKIQIKIEDLYGNVSTLTQTAEDLTLEISEERTERKMLIRSFIGGTITAYQGNAYGVYTNASGSVDIVTLAWSGSTPSITGTLASYGQTIQFYSTDSSGTCTAQISGDGISLNTSSGYNAINIVKGSTTIFNAGIRGSGLNAQLGGITISETAAAFQIGSNKPIRFGGSYALNADSGISATWVSTSGNLTGDRVYTRNPSYGSSDTANARIIAGTPHEIGYISNGSSRDLKHDIQPIEMEDIDPHRLYDAEVVQFVYNDDYLNKNDRRYGRPIPGFIAEDLMEVYPMAVDVEDGKAKTWNERYIIPPMLALIQEQNERIKELERRIECLNESTR